MQGINCFISLRCQNYLLSLNSLRKRRIKQRYYTVIWFLAFTPNFHIRNAATSLLISHYYQVLTKSPGNHGRKVREVVGITERFDESLMLIRSKLGWKKWPCYVKANIGWYDRERTLRSMKPEAIESVRKRNALDSALYEYALKRFESEIAGIQHLKAKLYVFRIANAVFRRRMR